MDRPVLRQQLARARRAAQTPSAGCGTRRRTAAGSRSAACAAARCCARIRRSHCGTRRRSPLLPRSRRVSCAACMRAMISVKQRAVVVGGAPRGKFGGDALDRAAIFQIVGRRLAVRGDQLHHRLRENLADHVGDIGAAAMPRDDQAALFQQSSARRAGSAATRRTGAPARARAGSRSATRSTPSRIRFSICCTTSSAVRTCSILEKTAPKAVLDGSLSARQNRAQVATTGQLIYPVAIDVAPHLQAELRNALARARQRRYMAGRMCPSVITTACSVGESHVSAEPPKTRIHVVADRHA